LAGDARMRGRSIDKAAWCEFRTFPPHRCDNRMWRYCGSGNVSKHRTVVDDLAKAIERVQSFVVKHCRSRQLHCDALANDNCEGDLDD